MWATLVWGSLGTAALATEVSAPDGSTLPDAEDAADVVVDGHVILKVRGVAAFPAEKRAREIAGRIVKAADDERIAPGDIKLTDKGDRTEVAAGDQYLFFLFDPDAEIEGVSRQVLAEATQLRLQSALTSYRYDRSPGVLTMNSLYALGATALSAALLFGLRRGTAPLIVWSSSSCALASMPWRPSRHGSSGRSSWPSSCAAS